MAGIERRDWDEVLRRGAGLARERGVFSWKDLAAALGVPRTSLVEAARKRGYRRVRELVRDSGRWTMDGGGGGRQIDGEAQTAEERVVEALKGGPKRLSELAELLDRSPGTVERLIEEMQAAGYAITRSEEQVSLPPYEPAPPAPTLYDAPRRSIRFGVFGDTHFGSKHAQVSALRKFIQIAVEQWGVENFLCTGDMMAGYGVYRGQQNDLYAMGADEQVESLCKSLPRYEGVRYFMIGGNHDYSFIRQNGINVIRLAAMQRPDIVYCGFDQAEIPLVERNGEVLASAILWHPSGGVPYALSYRGQKMAAEVSRRELAHVVLERKPSPTVRFIFWGHLHVSDFFPHGPIWVVGPGCFEGSNGYLKAKGLEPVIQGLVVEADLTEGGLVAGAHFHPYQFIEAVDDWRSGWDPRAAREARKVEAVFEWEGSRVVG